MWKCSTHDPVRDTLLKQAQAVPPKVLERVEASAVSPRLCLQPCVLPHQRQITAIRDPSPCVSFFPENAPSRQRSEAGTLKRRLGSCGTLVMPPHCSPRCDLHALSLLVAMLSTCRRVAFAECFLQASPRRCSRGHHSKASVPCLPFWYQLRRYDIVSCLQMGHPPLVPSAKK